MPTLSLFLGVTLSSILIISFFDFFSARMLKEKSKKNNISEFECQESLEKGFSEKEMVDISQPFMVKQKIVMKCHTVLADLLIFSPQLLHPLNLFSLIKKAIMGF